MSVIDTADLELHRAALTGHCYRMLGSAFDAEDAVQEAMVRAWKALDRFDGRSSLRTWLYRSPRTSASMRCPIERAAARPIEEGPVGTVDDALETQAANALARADARCALRCRRMPIRSRRSRLRQSTRLAFVAALQHLPPRQRAALLLSEVLGWSAQEVADIARYVGAPRSTARCSVPARRWRQKTCPRTAEPLSDTQARLLERYVDAFHEYDVDALVALMREDATLSMPPYTLWLQGPEAIRAWLLGRGNGCRGSRLIRRRPAARRRSPSTAAPLMAATTPGR